MSTSPITAAQIDETLNRTRSAVARLGTALFELDSDRERHGLDASCLRGQSAAAWAATGKQLNVLWAWYQALNTSVEGIDERRRSSRLGPKELDELWTQLSGDSVELPPDSLALARQCLPEAAALPDRVSVAYLITAISDAYQQAAETITTLSTVREMVRPRLDELDLALSTAESEARSARTRIPNEVAALRRQVDELREQAASDPLAVDVKQIPVLSASLEGVRAELAEAAASLEDLDQLFTRLLEALAVVEQEIQRAREVVSEASEKITAPRVTLDEVDALDPAVDEVRRALENARAGTAGDPQGAGQRARALESRVAALQTDATSLASVAAEQLSMRKELRGRLDAYRAKAQALGRGEDGVLDSIYRQARDVLYTSPCDLVQANGFLAAYQAAVLSPPLEDRQT